MSDSSHSNGSGKYRTLTPLLPDEERLEIAAQQRRDTEDALRALRGVGDDDWDAVTRPGVVVHVHQSSPDLEDEPQPRRRRRLSRPEIAYETEPPSESPASVKPEKRSWFISVLREFRLMINRLPPAWTGVLVLALIFLTAYFVHVTSQLGHLLD